MISSLAEAELLLNRWRGNGTPVLVILRLGSIAVHCAGYVGDVTDGIVSIVGDLSLDSESVTPESLWLTFPLAGSTCRFSADWDRSEMHPEVAAELASVDVAVCEPKPVVWAISHLIDKVDSLIVDFKPLLV